MGLLAPLYALAALAIAGPIVFHLIRRQPQGQMQFSSLMFLTPSPPRLTRRSRLDNLWLLLLRVLALGLIAIAFARPYWRQDSFLSNSLTGRRIAVLVDTSASMQRADVWAGAQQSLQQLFDSLSPQDQVALYTIDDQLTTVLGLDDQGATDPAASQQAARTAASQLKPTWKSTALGEGLKSVVDLLTSSAIAAQIDPTAQNEIVLVSDLHQGCQLDTLQGFPWPEHIRLDVRRIVPDATGNARVSLMQAAEDEAEESANVYRVRVENDADAATQTFRLAWGNAQAEFPEGSTSIQVPAGQIRIVPMSSRPPRAERILLAGDAWSGDNTAFVVEPVLATQRVVYCGATGTEPEDDVGYFLEKAPLATELVRREILRVTPAQLQQWLVEPETKSLVLEPVAGIEERTDDVRNFVQRGGMAIVSLSRPLTDSDRVQAWLAGLIGVEQLQITEAPERDFALLSTIDFQHPVFAPLADPRFNDFGKLRFWNHRSLQLPEAAPVQVVASFDDEQPWLLDCRIGQGHLWVMSAGWQPTGSGLALSTKFIPILMGMLDPQGRTRQRQLIYQVGEPLNVDDLESVQVLDAAQQPVPADQYILAGQRLTMNEPGLYWLVGQSVRRQVAIQVPASEGRLVPLDADQFSQYGIPLQKLASDVERRETERQLQITELESKQRLWQWLIAACLGVLALETFVAGWLHRR